MTRVSHQAETELNLGQQILLLLTIVQWLSEIGFEFSGFHGGSDGKETACNIGDPGLIPKLGRCPGEGNGNPLQYSCLENPMDRGAWWATVHRVLRVGHDWVTSDLPCSSDDKESACNAGDPGLIPELGRCSGEGNGNPLQYSCLENLMNRAAKRIFKSEYSLRDLLNNNKQNTIHIVVVPEEERAS